MRFVLTSLIRLYWRFWPKQYRRSCIFRESCSCYVYRIASKDGLFHGIRALFQRYRICRPGYSFVSKNTSISIRLVDGTVVSEDEVSPTIVEPFRRFYSRATSLDHKFFTQTSPDSKSPSDPAPVSPRDATPTLPAKLPVATSASLQCRCHARR